MFQNRLHARSFACGGALVAGLLLISGMVPAGGGITSEQQEILQHLSLVKLPDGQGNLLLTLRVSDLNLQLVNGQGGTEQTNGLGNLIVGYNESGSGLRTGSHNIVGGAENSYSSFGGLVTGFGNHLEGSYSAIAGGSLCRTQAEYACTVGGYSNTAGGQSCVAAGGSGNRALGAVCSVVGGNDNEASWLFTTVSGGQMNVASGLFATVGGGLANEAAHEHSTVAAGCGLVTTQDCEALP